MKHSSFSPQREPLSPGLYVVATPIGNLRDISFRALATLASVDLIACEDTRVTAKLLRHYGIETKTIAYHDHNAAKIRPLLLSRMQAGEKIALVSDAGTPLISDPGYKLVHEARAEHISVVAIPGASSVMAALCISGLPTDRFLFIGFLPATESKARKLIEQYAKTPASLVIFETPKDIATTCNLLAQTLGNRNACVCRELTKMYEESKQGTLQELAEYYTQHPSKGEMVLVIAPPLEEPVDREAIDVQLKKALAHMPLKQAVQEIATLFQLPRNEIYARALELKDSEL